MTEWWNHETTDAQISQISSTSQMHPMTDAGHIDVRANQAVIRW